MLLRDSLQYAHGKVTHGMATVHTRFPCSSILDKAPRPSPTIVSHPEISKALIAPSNWTRHRSLPEASRKITTPLSVPTTDEPAYVATAVIFSMVKSHSLKSQAVDHPAGTKAKPSGSTPVSVSPACPKFRSPVFSRTRNPQPATAFTDLVYAYMGKRFIRVRDFKTVLSLPQVPRCRTVFTVSPKQGR